MKEQALYYVLTGIAICLAVGAGVYLWLKPSISSHDEAPIWQPPVVQADPHPLLKDAEQAVLAAGDKLGATVDENLEATIRTVVRATAGRKLAALKIDYPLDGSIFPPEIVAPTFLWHDSAMAADTWLIDVVMADGSEHIYALVAGRALPRGEIDPRCLGNTNEVYHPTAYQASARPWTPDGCSWQAIKGASVGREAKVTISGFNSAEPGQVLSRGSMTLTVSKDPVGVPIFYRDVPLMPSEGEDGVIKPLAKSALSLIAWRLRDISKANSRVLLKDIPTCANCHSFSRDGRKLGMDLDGPSGDKGAYVMAAITRNMVIMEKDVITWNSYEDPNKIDKTIGFLSQISPDGQYAISTVNESVYVANFKNYKFLQVFYPTRGILAYYSQETGQFASLSGADDTDYVQCDPAWSPDGKWLVFARAKVPKFKSGALASYANDPEELQVQYDLCRIPFNDGRGGKAEPIAGASRNGMSNTFPKVSPDGKSIVFVKCRNGQLMRPDSKLWIVPFGGGKARLMTCNTSLMNSWHSFSPNGRWMVFSSKSNTPYTQMFLTHIAPDGTDSPPILIPNATAANRAVNIPEFVNIAYDELVSISAPTVEYYRHYDRGMELVGLGKLEEAILEFRKALEAEPTSARINNSIADSLLAMGRASEAITHVEVALETDPHNPKAFFHRARARRLLGDAPGALADFTDAIRRKPSFILAYVRRGRLLQEQGRLAEAKVDFDIAICLDSDCPEAWFRRGVLYDRQNHLKAALEDLNQAVRLNPKSASGYLYRGRVLDKLGRDPEALADYDVVCQVRPDAPEAWMNRGTLRVKAGDCAGAIADLSKCLQIAPADWSMRAEVQEKLQQLRSPVR